MSHKTVVLSACNQCRYNEASFILLDMSCSPGSVRHYHTKLIQRAIDNDTTLVRCYYLACTMQAIVFSWRQKLKRDQCQV